MNLVARTRSANPLGHWPLALASCLLAGMASAQSPAAVDNYLQRQAQAVGGSTAAWRLPESGSAHRLFLLGEVHGIAHGQQLDLRLLQVLHRQAGVRVYVGEFDFAQAELLNAYLRTGREAPLRAVLDGWQARSLQWASRDFADKLRAIRRWNQQLPPAERVRFFGADALQEPALACAQLASTLPPKVRSPQARALRSLALNPAACAQPQALARQAAALLAAPRAVAELRLAQRPTLALAMRALQIEARQLGRSETIAAHIRSLFEHSPRGTKGYGLWGLFHVVQAPVNGEAPMALRLEREGLTGGVVSLMLLSVRAHMMVPLEQTAQGTVYTAIAYTMDNVAQVQVDGIEDLKRHARGPLTLFAADAPGSPYPGSRLLSQARGAMAEQQPFVIDTAAAGPRGAVQAYLLSQDSPATQAWPPRGSPR